MDILMKEQREEIARLRSVCGEAYQMAGALGASVEALDNLSAVMDWLRMYAFAVRSPEPLPPSHRR